ncbi:hypothetical protein [Candidatus Puniceispirillum marinum]|nr:hypothetical protein [Candidatus Puniceispirillum marinum]
MMLRKIIKASVALLVLLVIAAGSIIYISMEQEHSRTQIEPFGLSLGLRDVGYVETKSPNRERVDTVFVSTPMISHRAFEKLDPNGYCRTTFGDRLTAPSFAYYLKETPNPLQLPNPISNDVIYRVYVHPIIGIYAISALINPKPPSNYIGEWYTWNFHVHDIVKNEVLDTLEKKYPNLLVYVTSLFDGNKKDFESFRTDDDGRRVHITFDYQQYGSRQDGGGTSLSYVWHFMGILDKEQDIATNRFDKCNEELTPIYQTFERERKDKEEKKRQDEDIKRRLEEERKKTVKSTL